MPDFEYVARELSGKEVTGVLTAGSQHEALQTLSSKSLFPTRIGLAQSEQVRQKQSRRRVKGGQLAVFYSQLADLLHAGVPLLRSLEILETQSSKSGLGAVLRDVREEVADGMRFADSMKVHQRVFGELAISMVRAGEEGGFLEDVLKRIAGFTEHQEELKGKVIGSLVYPLFLIGIGSIIVILMLIFFVPKFTPIFERLKARGELPYATTILIAMSEFTQHYWMWALVPIIGGYFLLQQYLSTEDGKRKLDRFRLSFIGVGPILKSLAISRLCRILGTLIHNGVPILHSLRISKDATGSVILSDAISKAADNLQAGKELARPLAASQQFPVEVVEMIAVGEEANNLENVLIDISDNLERRTYRQLDLFVRMLEPVLLTLIALMVLFVVVALLLPVFQSSGLL